MMHPIRLFGAMVLLAFLASCGDSEDSDPAPDNGTMNNTAMPDVGTGQGPDCVNDDACAVGSVCSAGGDCIRTSCENCTEFQACYVTNENPDGSCTAGLGDFPTSGESCEFDTDCDLGAVCSASNLCIVVGCALCTEDQICYQGSDLPDGSCSAPECSNETDCADDESCVDGQCSTI